MERVLQEKLEDLKNKKIRYFKHAIIKLGYVENGIHVTAQSKHKKFNLHDITKFVTKDIIVGLAPWKKKNSYMIALSKNRKPPLHLVTAIDEGMIFTAMGKGYSYYGFEALEEFLYDGERLERLVNKSDMIKFFEPSKRYVDIPNVSSEREMLNF